MQINEKISESYNFFVGKDEGTLSPEEKIDALNRCFFNSLLKAEKATSLEVEVADLRKQLATARADATIAFNANREIQRENANLREWLRASDARERETHKNLWGFLERVVTIR